MFPLRRILVPGLSCNVAKNESLFQNNRLGKLELALYGHLLCCQSHNKRKTRRVSERRGGFELGSRVVRPVHSTINSGCVYVVSCLLSQKFNDYEVKLVQWNQIKLSQSPLSRSTTEVGVQTFEGIFSSWLFFSFSKACNRRPLSD